MMPQTIIAEGSFASGDTIDIDRVRLDLGLAPDTPLQSGWFDAFFTFTFELHFVRPLPDNEPPVIRVKWRSPGLKRIGGSSPDDAV